MTPTISATSSLSSSPPPDPCIVYTTINDPSREVSNGYGYGSDSGLDAGWYRFLGDGNFSYIPTSPPPFGQCGTLVFGWISTAMPLLVGQQVEGNACFGWTGNTCVWSTDILIKNCGGSYFGESAATAAMLTRILPLLHAHA